VIGFGAAFQNVLDASRDDCARPDRVDADGFRGRSQRGRLAVGRFHSFAWFISDANAFPAPRIDNSQGNRKACLPPFQAPLSCMDFSLMPDAQGSPSEWVSTLNRLKRAWTAKPAGVALGRSLTGALLGTGLFLMLLSSLSAETNAQTTTAVPVMPSEMPRLGAVDERYQSYNVEMLEVTGGKFWKPYGQEAVREQKPPADAQVDPSTPEGMDPSLYEYRPPLDLGNRRLRALAAVLAPAYVRVSGTWANATYFPTAGKAPGKPPAGFNGVLTHLQWKGVVDFASATGSRIVTSFANSPGTRDADGQWNPVQAQRFVEYTQSIGGHLAAAEFMNEPTLAAMGGAPKGYDAQEYGRDFRAFHDFAKKSAPEMLVLGPGSVGETTRPGAQLAYGLSGIIRTQDLLQASGPGVDAFSYHHYGAASQRCAGAGTMPTTTAAAALSEEWLSRTDATLAFYRGLRDQFEPGKPLWVTETAETACGGNPWSSTFLDTFRYLDQLGRLAKGGVQVVMHNTLTASDYALLDDHTHAPRPNYWAALLWRKSMGTVVLDAGIPIEHGLHVYAHSLRGKPGGVALLAINTDQSAPRFLTLPIAGERYTLSAADLQKGNVLLNGTELKLSDRDELPPLSGVPSAAGRASFEPGTITFLALPEANNKDCQ
jgi:heparanase 1